MATVAPLTASITCVDLAEYTRLMANLDAGHLPNIQTYEGNEATLTVTVTTTQITVMVP